MKTQSTMSMTYLWFQSLVGTQEKDEVDVNKYKNEFMGTKKCVCLDYKPIDFIWKKSRYDLSDRYRKKITLLIAYFFEKESYY